jgi:hypothetical protein
MDCCARLCSSLLNPSSNSRPGLGGTSVRMGGAPSSSGMVGRASPRSLSGMSGSTSQMGGITGTSFLRVATVMCGQLSVEVQQHKLRVLKPQKIGRAFDGFDPKRCRHQSRRGTRLQTRKAVFVVPPPTMGAAGASKCSAWWLKAWSVQRSPPEEQSWDCRPWLVLCLRAGPSGSERPWGWQGSVRES